MPATEDDLADFHSDEYISFIKKYQKKRGIGQDSQPHLLSSKRQKTELGSDAELNSEKGAKEKEEQEEDEKDEEEEDEDVEIEDEKEMNMADDKQKEEFGLQEDCPMFSR